RLLLENGAEASATGGKYGTALQAASIQGHVGSVQLLLQYGADVNTAGGVHGSASRNGYINIVRLLPEKGADVNAVGRSCGSALKAAARLHGLGETNYCHAKEIIRILHEHGADER
ncbi:ankyrin repeat-containing domain protein, partial [Mycena albidolilacea]